jgi:FtsH-binding integral membrane protein
MKDGLMDFLAYAAVGGLLLTIVALMFIEIPEGNRDILFVMIGVLLIMARTPYDFKFGSSQGSKDKDK